MKQGFYLHEIINAFLATICGDSVILFPTSIVIPINHPKGVHYSLIVIKNSTIYHLNSWWNKQRSRDIFSDILDSFEPELDELLVEPCTKKLLPQQQYDCDCGVFLCWFVDMFIKNQLDVNNVPQACVHVPEMRRRILQVILSKADVAPESKVIIEQICADDEEN